MNKSVSGNRRIEMVDALRGFAVMAILLVHSLEHFIYPVYPATPPEWLAVIDKGVFETVFALFAGKAYAIFALLFGFTFFIQYDNRRAQGKDFGYRFLWRLVLLAVFATLNAAFFPAGDVLQLFVVVGIVLFIVRGWSDKAVIAAAVVCLAQPIEWFHFIAGCINPDYTLPDLKVGEMYGRVAEVTASGNLADFFLTNITLGQKASLLWAVNAGRFFQTAGLFLCGLYIGRRHLFADSGRFMHKWVAILIVSAVLYAPLGALRQLAVSGDGIVPQTVGTVFDMWQKLAFTFVLISSFVLLYTTAGFRKITSDLRFYGRMSLTNYISQSVAGALIYFPVGLSLAPYCGYTVSLLVGIVTFFCQVYFCKRWLATHRQGPLERIWHKWTWMKL